MACADVVAHLGDQNLLCFCLKPILAAKHIILMNVEDQRTTPV